MEDDSKPKKRSPSASTRQRLSEASKGVWANLEVRKARTDGIKRAFINSCLIYYGGPYQLQNVTFKKHWTICVKDPSALSNYSSLLYALDPMKPSQHFHKTPVIPRR